VQFLKFWPFHFFQILKIWKKSGTLIILKNQLQTHAYIPNCSDDSLPLGHKASKISIIFASLQQIFPLCSAYTNPASARFWLENFLFLASTTTAAAAAEK
jgi:hypothetical protein